MEASQFLATTSIENVFWLLLDGLNDKDFKKIAESFYANYSSPLAAEGGKERWDSLVEKGNAMSLERVMDALGDEVGELEKACLKSEADGTIFGTQDEYSTRLRTWFFI